MMQTMIPKSLKAMRFYFTTVYQEIWVGVALTAYAYYKISYGAVVNNEMSQTVERLDRESNPLLSQQEKKQWQINPLVLAIIKDLFWEYGFVWFVIFTVNEANYNHREVNSKIVPDPSAVIRDRKKIH